MFKIHYGNLNQSFCTTEIKTILQLLFHSHKEFQFYYKQSISTADWIIILTIE